MKHITARLLHSPWTLALLGGVLLSTAWTPGIALGLFAGQILWIYLIERLAAPNVQGARAYLIFLSGTITWNLLTVWWLVGATIGGMLGAVIAMSILMSALLMLVRWAWRLKGRNVALLALTVGVIAYEYFFHNSEIAWPWLTLGNGFAKSHLLVQWYEYTGVLGGSLWVLLLSSLLFVTLKTWRNRTAKQRYILLSACLLAVIGPIGASFFLLHREQNAPQGPAVQVVIVQPNIDPWNDKFGGMSALQQAERMVHLADSAITPNTLLVLSPETSLPQAIWQHKLTDDPQVEMLRDFLRRHPNTQWITGATTLQLYTEPNQMTPTARTLPNNPLMAYDATNTALLIDTSLHVDLYRKSKLVVGVEMLPYPAYLKWLNNLSIDLGGIVGSLATQPERTVFSVGAKMRTAPIICYESAFGEFCTEYIARGANLLTVITNDGWWGDTPGYRQHFSFSRLRCIETRRYMARSANTGISAFIDPTGNIMQTLGWWQQGALCADIQLRERRTFYSQHGDYLGRAATAFSALLLLYLAVQAFLARRHK